MLSQLHNYLYPIHKPNKYNPETFYKSQQLHIWLCTTCTTIPGSPPQPAIGDIKLVSNHGDSNLQGFYEVLIYFSNGVDQPDYGGICADDSYSEEAEVICNQLGYTYVDFGLEAIKICPNYTTPYFTSKNTNHLVWLKDVFCKQSDQHILRCRHNVTYGRERINQNTCAKKLHIKCGKTVFELIQLTIN